MKSATDKMFAGHEEASYLARADWHLDRDENDQADFWKNCAAWMRPIDSMRAQLAEPSTIGLGHFSHIGRATTLMPAMAHWQAGRWAINCRRRGITQIEYTLQFRDRGSPLGGREREMVTALDASADARRRVLLTLVEYAMRCERIARSAPNVRQASHLGSHERMASILATWLRDLDVPFAGPAEPVSLRCFQDGLSRFCVPFGADCLIEVGDGHEAGLGMRILAITSLDPSETSWPNQRVALSARMRQRIAACAPGDPLPAGLIVQDVSQRLVLADPVVLYRRLCLELRGQIKHKWLANDDWITSMPPLPYEEDGLPWKAYPA